MNYIEYKGVKYPSRVVPKEKLPDEIGIDYDVEVSVSSLWDALSEDYFDDTAAVVIDDSIFFYCDDEFLEKNPTDAEIGRYLMDNI